MIHDRNIADNANIQPHKILGNKNPLGRVLFVGGNSVTARRYAPSTKLYATLAAALLDVESYRGDVIFILPDHAENVAANLTISKHGVSIVGLGGYANRPTYTFTAQAGWVVTAEDVTIDNIHFVANFLSVAAAIESNGTDSVDGLTVQNCRFTETSAILNFVRCVDVSGANTADGVRLLNNDAYLPAGATNGGFCNFGNAQNELQVVGNRISGLFVEAVLDFLTVGDPHVLVTDNWLYNTDATDVMIEFGASSGWIHNNVIHQTGGTLATMITYGSVVGGVNYCTNAVGETAAAQTAIGTAST